jgi:hypothetical protein
MAILCRNDSSSTRYSAAGPRLTRLTNAQNTLKPSQTRLQASIFRKQAKRGLRLAYLAQLPTLASSVSFSFLNAYQ